MDIDRLIDRTIVVQSIPAPTFHETARRAYLQSEFEHAGLLDIEIDSVGNLYGRVPGKSKPPLIVSAHLDTVFPADTPLDVQRVGDRLIGPGIGDNALSLAALIELAIDLPSTQPPGDIWLVATVCEEGLGNLIGMREVVKRFQDNVSAYIVLEGMSLGQIYNAGLPARRYRLTINTQGGHAWIHAGRTSAIHRLLEVGSQIAKLRLPERPRTSLNIGKIEGGISVNSIASHAHLDIDMRSEKESTLSDLEQDLMKCIQGVDIKDAEMDIEQIGVRPGGKLPQHHPLLRAAIEAIQSVGEDEIHISCGSTDANIPLHLGFPAICFGLTHGGGAHSMQEHIEIEPITRGYQALLKIIQAALELDSLD